ncbi:MltR family transcriptional regulator [Variovorax sp. 22077]|uniref:MltR family transcriptional regulator n=1 Tax=Variovorax sp. 22077 TaxID=3453867 RepID=UPI003F873574
MTSESVSLPDPKSDSAVDRRINDLFGEMLSESDRGVILVGASAVDDALRSLLVLKLARDEHVAKVAADPLFAGMGPLATFSSRIKLAYAMDLIPRWMFEDLERIRKVRNKAAHEMSAKTFESNEVVQMTGALTAVSLARDSKPVHSLSALEKAASDPGTDPRLRALLERANFQVAVGYIAGYLDRTSR